MARVCCQGSYAVPSHIALSSGICASLKNLADRHGWGTGQGTGNRMHQGELLVGFGGGGGTHHHDFTAMDVCCNTSRPGGQVKGSGLGHPRERRGGDLLWCRITPAPLVCRIRLLRLSYPMQSTEQMQLKGRPDELGRMCCRPFHPSTLPIGIAKSPPHLSARIPWKTRGRDEKLEKPRHRWGGPDPPCFGENP